MVAALAAAVLSAAPALAAPPAAPFNWSGFYVGGNVGYGWGSGSLRDLPDDFFGAPNPVDFRARGILGGIELGYNWQSMTNWVAGFEGDFAAAKLSAS